ncbi:MAG: DNA replication and repair protein RecF [Candidatus Margulisiibacteriota bacterium]
MIHSIWIKSFRCLKENLFSFEKDPFISIISKNNVGKTSLLEACYVLGNLNSFTTKNLANVVPFEQDISLIGIKLNHLNRSLNYYLKIDSLGKKYITLNNQVVRRKTDIQSLFRVNYISSDSLFFITSQPSFRRKELDQSLSQFSLSYRKNLATYKRLILQKNKLFKMNQDTALIRNINKLLAPLIIEIQKERILYLREVETRINEFFNRIKFPLQSLEIKYQSKTQFLTQADQVLDFLNENLSKESLSRMSLYGPHRDDFIFIGNERVIKEFYSRGVCRTVAYFFQLSQSLIMQDKTQLPMLLLLDEPFSEIYKDLKSELISQIPNSFYVIYTSTQKDEITSLKNSSLYAINDGLICKI